MTQTNQSIAPGGREEQIRRIREVLRDIPVLEDPESPTAPVPAEFADAIAVHFWHCGGRIVETPDRVWEPPEYGPVHSLNPGKWKEVSHD